MTTTALTSLRLRISGLCEPASQVYGDGPKGFFVDVGGYDGIQDSNSSFLEKELGWKGVIIEPDPESFSRLKEKTER